MLSESYPQNTNMTGYRWFYKTLHPRALDVKSLSIGRVNPFTLRVSLESIVCYFRTFVNNSGIKQKLSKYLKESCRLTSG